MATSSLSKAAFCAARDVLASCVFGSWEVSGSTAALRPVDQSMRVPYMSNERARNEVRDGAVEGESAIVHSLNGSDAALVLYISNNLEDLFDHFVPITQAGCTRVP